MAGVPLAASLFIILAKKASDALALQMLPRHPERSEGPHPLAMVSLKLASVTAPVNVRFLASLGMTRLRVIAEILPVCIVFHG
jgi:hypothetical protein